MTTTYPPKIEIERSAHGKRACLVARGRKCDLEDAIIAAAQFDEELAAEYRSILRTVAADKHMPTAIIEFRRDGSANCGAVICGVRFYVDREPVSGFIAIPGASFSWSTESMRDRIKQRAGLDAIRKVKTILEACGLRGTV